MLEPSLAFQTAVRAALLAAVAVTNLVPANCIRAGSTVPDRMPSIILTGGQTEFLGRAAGQQFVARVYLDLHIWAMEDGADTAKAIGFAAFNALKSAPVSADYKTDSYEPPVIRWLRDPQPELAFTHGIMTLEAVIRWSL
jgi:hypothetical protein